MHDDDEYNSIEKGKVRVVTTMLLMSSKLEINVLKRSLATGPTDDPFDALDSRKLQQLIYC
ncbi:hypothetical protein Lser_V15G31318 [Lactuca serriola]